jgi:hypothetical protein
LVSPVCASRQQRARVDRRSEERLRCLLPELDFRVGLRVRKQFVHRGAAEKPLFEPSQGSVRRPCSRIEPERVVERRYPVTRMKRAKFGIRETAPRRSPPAGEVPFFRTNPDCENEFARHCV